MSPRSRIPVLLSLFLIGAAASANAASKLTSTDLRNGEQHLAELGFWTGPVDGVWDGASRQALIAFQKVQGARPTGVLTRAELNALSMATPLERHEAEMGPRIEVDIARQVLYVVGAEGEVGNIVPISSGSGRTFRENGYPETRAVTPCGHLQVYAKAQGWKTSPLGQMHNPMYIVGGIAIHGSNDMRTYPASHGCIRIPMFASERLTRMVPTGTRVVIFGCSEDGAAVVAGGETASSTASAAAPR
ncbi:MAG TPA: L,D-transpeptidase family protein [Thermoanaerobaculia bacterium]|jgi:lipoprotein-anchoring transpeptidase ErfK/SrfK|nr:L,D-transpeptidase family protein [Thermoanaerobaculia bacterium]